LAGRKHRKKQGNARREFHAIEIWGQQAEQQQFTNTEHRFKIQVKFAREQQSDIEQIEVEKRFKSRNIFQQQVTSGEQSFAVDSFTGEEHRVSETLSRQPSSP
jgi:hypothetical protein